MISIRAKATLSAFFLLVAVVGVGVAVVQAEGSPKVDICHIPPGNPENAHVITVSENAIPAHLAHGDMLDSCRGPE
jgi:hypothetical protein